MKYFKILCEICGRGWEFERWTKRNINELLYCEEGWRMIDGIGEDGGGPWCEECVSILCERLSP